MYCQICGSEVDVIEVQWREHGQLVSECTCDECEDWSMPFLIEDHDTIQQIQECEVIGG